MSAGALTPPTGTGSDVERLLSSYRLSHGFYTCIVDKCVTFQGETQVSNFHQTVSVFGVKLKMYLFSRIKPWRPERCIIQYRIILYIINLKIAFDIKSLNVKLLY